MSTEIEKDLSDRLWKLKLWAAFAFGLLFIWTSDTRIQKWLMDWLLIHVPFTEVGFALVIASFLGWAIDQELKRGLVRDAVRAALGYLLPDPLKAELRWVYEQRFLTAQTYHIRLEHDEQNHIVRLYGHVTRLLRNTTDEPAEYEIGGGIDEWFHPCGVESVISSSTMTRKNIVTQLHQKRSLVGISYLGEKLILEPKEEIEISFSYIYSMPECGFEVLTFAKPIENPLVTMQVPDTLRARVVFSNRASTKMDETTPAAGYLSIPLKGVLLPFQDIRVYWMTAKQLAARQASL